MKKFTLSLTFLVFAIAFLNAQTTKVTIQVNMDQITDKHRGGDVWVYMDADWNEYYTMTADDNDSIYSFMVEKEAGTTLTYSFSYQTGPNSDNDYVVETVPNECANGGGLREITVPATDISLPAVVYGSCYESGITLRVNLSDVEDLYDGGSVWVYMDADWNEYYTMTDDNGDGIYAFTLIKAPGTTLYYSFSYQNGANPDNDYITEVVPDACAADNGFRELAVTAGDNVLPAYSFGSCDEVAPPMVNITFQVDMSNETVVNNDVQVVIKNPWIWTALTDQGNGIWSGTVEVNPDNTYPYTFVNGGQDVWEGEEKVDAGCNFGSENAPERHVTVAGSDTTLLITEFGKCATEVPTAKVTIQVNMSQVEDLYEGGDVWVYMDADWNEYYTMTADANDSIYSYTVEKGVGTKLTYSFSYQTGADSSSEYVVESVPAECANSDGFREFTIPASDATLKAVSYGSCYETGITIRVNLNNVSDLYEGGAVWVYMDADWNEYYDMTDSNNDGIYAFTLMKDPGTTLYYGFSYQNGPDPNSNYVTETVPDGCSAENGFRQLAVTAGDTVLPVFAYGSCDDGAPKTINVTFKVDMTGTEVLNNDVQVVIKNPWIWTALTDHGDGIWSGTVEVNGDATYPYTFVNGGQDNWSGEESVPAACNEGTESAPERHISVGDADTSLVIVAFASCGPSVSAYTIEDGDVKIYPNPANDILNISVASGSINSYKIVDITGRIVVSETAINNRIITLKVSGLNNGIYSVITESNKAITISKIIINH